MIVCVEMRVTCFMQERRDLRHANVNSKYKLPCCLGGLLWKSQLSAAARDQQSCRFNMIQSACNQPFFGKRIKFKRQRAVCGYLSAFWREILISKRTLLTLIRSASFPTLLSCCALGLLFPVCIPKNPLLPLFGHHSELLSLIFFPPQN